MKNFRNTLLTATAFVFTLSYASTATATVVTNDLGTLAVPGTTNASGMLANNSTALFEMFTLTSDATLSAFTTSYAGGGFQPNLQLFTAAGTLITNQAFSNGDSSLSASLMAGSYIALLSQFDYQLDPTVTTLTTGSAFIGPFTTGFSDEMGATRTGAYALTLTTGAAVPEPASVGLLAGSGLTLCLLAWKRRKASA